MTDERFTIPFVAPYSYNPAPGSDELRKVESILQGFKAERIERKSGDLYAKILIEGFSPQFRQDRRSAEFFGEDVSAVPVPSRSLPLPKQPWVPMTVCQLLQDASLVRNVVPALSRCKPVQKSRGRPRLERPSAQTQARSLNLKPGLDFGPRILLVDDVVTTGTTLLGCALRIREDFPEIRIAALAMFRADNNLSSRSASEAPTFGKLDLDADGHGWRRP